MKALLIVDIQKSLTNRKLYNSPLFFDTVNYTIEKYRESGDLIIFIQHNNKQLVRGEHDWEIDSGLHIQNADVHIQKEHGNAFEKTDLKSTLDTYNIKEILVCGLVSHGCIKLTCIGSMELGYQTSLLVNGHTNWNKDAAAKITQTESDLGQLGVKMLDKHSL